MISSWKGFGRPQEQEGSQTDAKFANSNIGGRSLKRSVWPKAGKSCLQSMIRIVQGSVGLQKKALKVRTLYEGVAGNDRVTPSPEQTFTNRYWPEISLSIAFPVMICPIVSYSCYIMKLGIDISRIRMYRQEKTGERRRMRGRDGFDWISSTRHSSRRRIRKKLNATSRSMLKLKEIGNILKVATSSHLDVDGGSADVHVAVNNDIEKIVLTTPTVGSSNRLDAKHDARLGVVDIPSHGLGRVDTVGSKNVVLTTTGGSTSRGILEVSVTTYDR